MTTLTDDTFSERSSFFEAIFVECNLATISAFILNSDQLFQK